MSNGENDILTHYENEGAWGYKLVQERSEDEEYEYGQDDF